MPATAAHETGTEPTGAVMSGTPLITPTSEASSNQSQPSSIAGQLEINQIPG
jgi:hypothetical protein